MVFEVNGIRQIGGKAEESKKMLDISSREAFLEMVKPMSPDDRYLAFSSLLEMKSVAYSDGDKIKADYFASLMREINKLNQN
jgi:hypothetical protein